MNGFVFDFEKPIVELEKKIQEMKEYAFLENVELSEEIARLEAKAEKLRQEIYSRLTRWQRVQLARHPQRPYTLNYLERIAPDFLELHGDRLFADDPAIVAGIATIDNLPVVIIGHQKGRTTKEKLFRNFGMPNPEGYRKALRVMRLAVKFNRPVISFIDTPGAYPGIGAEERGQAEAIARNLFEMSHLPVPILIVVIGEGASGGALGIGVGDRILMMENTWYSVISPEGCAAILWRDSAKAEQAAEAMKVTATDLFEMGIADEIIKEPVGGAHRDYDRAAEIVKERILHHLHELMAMPEDVLVNKRIEKYRKIGYWEE
ncbi:acetyl-CoA carboxylase carboxyl transferase subunit alpha [candidate division KSB1 bacterium]|nr:acetyl-CoA carboxylase carboxyltransferase subunit alpha [bacterium]OQX60576.1 MAG: acetyl-CoA carboxylase carboxyl transferase subunit alpha [candidate division KSB1 bacterium 4484_219]RKY77509.1 MAG: acetyl-CoA carboxylase carboxyl transferase subunit alpha [candidate division KSB1 bacterium]HDI52104.1 acetyl-CoA carboxylase carboxyltransferase subunit alpha [Bacteroidota bacterium]RKY77956.1 MAG: acetyl-CoA carboxylase carboxyl transferase subunit alpha [candidate division KSB1 bacterium]